MNQVAACARAEEQDFVNPVLFGNPQDFKLAFAHALSCVQVHRICQDVGIIAYFRRRPPLGREIRSIDDTPAFERVACL